MVPRRTLLWLTPCFGEEKERSFLCTSASSGLLEVSSMPISTQQKTRNRCIGHSSRGGRPYDNIHWFCSRPPLCLSVLVLFCKCSWHFVYLSFKHSAKIMSANEREKPNHTSLVKSLARETIQHHSHNTKTVSRHLKVSRKLLGQDQGCSSNVRGTRYVLVSDATWMKSDLYWTDTLFSPLFKWQS